MKTVRIVNGIVAEIIPSEASPVADWYGESFAAQCVEAPDEVDQNWTQDPETGAFYPPMDSPDRIYTSDDLFSVLLGREEVKPV